eukprot:CAMPEP_0194087252 /NCGR_PEP_ID=MMETSP0149-20130528/24158_1 /TAXON_ID=122233 /ORGANISM="Chaetoceros debilis, Strain MM31A-1" /LENGTH=560 /DNA_ID=CAMNT_0038770545 /DNA_START=207 /DNA_END=1889 /DNA_ORIENTATION=+
MTIASAAASLAVSSTAASTSTLALSNVLSLARGGAIAAAVTTAASSTLLQPKKDVSNIGIVEKFQGMRGGGPLSNITPEGSSVLYMAIAMSLHYLSYSIARPSTIALFTSAKTGFAGNTAAFPLAMAFISPTSLALLFLYGKILSNAGPRGTIRQTTFLCASALWLSGILIVLLQGMDLDPLSIPFIPGASIKVIQLVVGALFIFRESYVQLLTSQYWAFMASILTPDQSAKWFSPISGLTSITSAASGLGVRSLVEKLGLPGALGVAGVILVTSLIFTEKAYTISDAGGFTPADDQMKKKPRHGSSNTRKTSTEQEEGHEAGLVKKASALFGRVPVLKALFIEILAGQGLATLLNVLFVTKLSESLPDDTVRAGWMGKFFASINVVAMCLQFGVIPRIMPHLEPRYLWRFMPMTMVTALSYLCLNENPTLYLISGCFMLFKVMEFSIRRMLDEMVYVPLDFESRFLGKEIISVFGYRFGKSGMSLALSGLTSMFGDFGLQQLSFLTGGAAGVWLLAAFNVSNLVFTRAEAEIMYQSKRGGGSKSSTSRERRRRERRVRK